MRFAILSAFIILGSSTVWGGYPTPDTLPTPTASSPPASSPDDNPLGLLLSGSAQYQDHISDGMIQIANGQSGNRIQISFEPTVSFLPASVTIDLGNREVTQADVTLLRVWFLHLLSYHRDTDASIKNDLEFFRFSVPAVVQSFGNSTALVRVVVRVGGEVGYRWMGDDHSGVYFEPNAAVSATATILNRIFASAYAQGTATVMTGGENAYVSGASGFQLGVGITNDNMLRFVVNASIHYDGANEAAGLPVGSEYLGAGIMWGADPAFIAPVSENDGNQL